MTIRSVIVVPAVFVSLSTATTVAWAYFPSQFQLQQSADSQASASSSSTSSSSAPVNATSSDASSSSPLFHPVGDTSNQQLTQQASCMQIAANKRENDIAQSLDAYYKDVSNALNERHNLILQAWNYTDPEQQRLALQAIWRNFGMYWQEADSMMQALIRNAWKQYRLDRAECGETGYDPESGGFGADSQF